MARAAGQAVMLGGSHRVARVDARGPKTRSLLTVLLTALLVCVGLLVLEQRLAPRGSAGSGTGVGLRDPASVTLPVALAQAASASIGTADRRFRPERGADGLHVRGGGIDGSFTAAFARLRVPDGTLRLSLLSVGRGRDLGRVAASSPVVGAGGRVLYRDRSVEESYRNGPYGLEQDFQIEHRPRGGAGPLVLALRLGGSLSPKLRGRQIVFATRAGAVALRYGQLSVVDATGRRLPASIDLWHGVLQLRVSDAGARYPLRIDPFIQQGPALTSAEQIGVEKDFGQSIALSADGNTALIGDPGDRGGTGAAWVFVRSGSTWSQQGPELTGGGETVDGRFGYSVALSASGYTALIGGYGDGEVGAAWVFTRTGSTWTQQGKKLAVGGKAREGLFGVSVALSADGSTALIGRAGNGAPGSVYVLTRAGSTWSQQGPALTGGEERGIQDEFGGSLALSADGNTALIGGAGDDEGVGAVWVFTRSGATWSQQGPKLTGGEERGAAELGDSVALSADGDTALVGGRLDGSERYGDNIREVGLRGAAWVFTRSGSTWSQQGPKLTPIDESGEAYFGARVAIAGDGSTALIGGFRDDEGLGAAWVFKRSGSTWTQQGEKLAGDEEESGEGAFGTAVALSSGSTALIGSGGNNRPAGVVWPFVQAQPGCGDSWTNSAGGSWFDGEDWSNGAPPDSEEAACIVAPGSYTVTMQQTSATGTVTLRSLTIGGSSGTQTLAVAGSCSQDASLTAAAGIEDRWHGALELTDGEECASAVALMGPVANSGELAVEGTASGARTIAGNLTNSGTVSLAAGERLQVAGGYQQAPPGRLKTLVAGTSDYGSMDVAEGISLAGTLAVEQVPPFVGLHRESFTIVGEGHSLSGAFTAETGDQIDFFPGLYYKPVYYARHGAEYTGYFVHGVTLDVTQATVTLSPKSGPAGSTVTVAGGEYHEYLPGDTVTPGFTDSEGHTTVYPGVTVSAAGTFSTEIAIPAGAAASEGTVFVQSSQTGARINRSFTVG
jgi:hypothetical protein